MTSQLIWKLNDVTDDVTGYLNDVTADVTVYLNDVTVFLMVSQLLNVIKA